MQPLSPKYIDGFFALATVNWDNLVETFPRSDAADAVADRHRPCHCSSELFLARLDDPCQVDVLGTPNEQHGTAEVSW